MRFASFEIALGFLALGLAPIPVFAATSSVSFGVSATVESTCQATSPAAAFGSYPTAARSAVSVTCTVLTPYTVTLSAPLTANDTQKVAGPAKPLAGYALSPAAAHAVYRKLVGGTSTAAAAGNGSPYARNTYGQTAWTRSVASGAFADAVTVTVTY